MIFSNTFNFNGCGYEWWWGWGWGWGWWRGVMGKVRVRGDGEGYGWWINMMNASGAYMLFSYQTKNHPFTHPTADFRPYRRRWRRWTTDLQKREYMYACICMYVYVYVCMYVFMYACVYVCMCAYVMCMQILLLVLVLVVVVHWWWGVVCVCVCVCAGGKGLENQRFNCRSAGHVNRHVIPYEKIFFH